MRMAIRVSRITQPQRHVPPHLGLPAADPVLEVVVEGLVPVQRRVGGGGGGGLAAHPEMREGVVVRLPVEVLRLEDDAVAVEDEGVERPRGGSRGARDDVPGLRSPPRIAQAAEGGEAARGDSTAEGGRGGRRGCGERRRRRWGGGERWKKPSVIVGGWSGVE